MTWYKALEVILIIFGMALLVYGLVHAWFRPR